jgi:hypothetical protein
MREETDLRPTSTKEDHWMALVSMRQLLDHAAEYGYGLPAFNVNNMEQIQAIMQAADECDSPVILQGSAGARKYAGEAFLRHLVEAAVETYPHIPVAMHQDSRRKPCCMSTRNPLRLFERYDGWLPARGYEDAILVRLQC